MYRQLRKFKIQVLILAESKVADGIYFPIRFSVKDYYKDITVVIMTRVIMRLVKVASTQVT